MTILAGAFALRDSWSPQRPAKTVAEHSCRYPSLAARELIRDRRIACYWIRPEEQASEPVVVESPSSTTLILIGEVASPQASASAAAVFRPLVDPAAPLSALPHGRWIALAHDRQSGGLRLMADPLGTAWLYLGRFEGGYVFASDFGAVASALPGRLTPDYDTVAAYLGLGYTPDDRTCFHEITILPPGAVVELRPEGPVVLRARCRIYGDRHASLPVPAKYELLDGVLDRSIGDWCGGRGADLVVSLSGGYDSRYALALLQARGIAPRCMTFGHPRSKDARGARGLCEALGLDFELYTMERTSWATWERCVQQAGVIGGFQWGAWAEDWLERLRRAGRSVLLGYLGDALSGKHLVQRPEHRGDWLRDWETWSLDEGWAGSPLLRPEAGDRLRRVVRERLDQVAGEAEVAFPHQRALHLDLYGRQRRFVAAQPNLMARFVSPVPFFYTMEGIDFWSNLPFDDLRRQALYLSYARARFPALFGEPKRPASPLLRVRGALTNLGVRLVPALKQVLAPGEIDRRAIIRRHRVEIVEVVKAVGPLLEPLVDPLRVTRAIETYPRGADLNTVQLLRLVNLAALLRLSVDRG
jgi:hypothetical protein